MSRFSMVLAASVATAMLVIAIATLDAVGAGKPTADSVLQARFAACMRSHDVAVPELSGEALDRWFETHAAAGETVRACKMAVAPGPDVARKVAPDPGEADKSDTVYAEKLAACLQARGLDAPSDPFALKRWIAEQHTAAATRALDACGVSQEPACGDKKPLRRVEKAGAGAKPSE
jgi:hypothetical protein